MPAASPMRRLVATVVVLSLVLGVGAPSALACGMLPSQETPADVVAGAATERSHGEDCPMETVPTDDLPIPAPSRMACCAVIAAPAPGSERTGPMPGLRALAVLIHPALRPPPLTAPAPEQASPPPVCSGPLLHLLFGCFLA